MKGFEYLARYDMSELLTPFRESDVVGGKNRHCNKATANFMGLTHSREGRQVSNAG
jgi:hypothetical protein